MLGCTIEGYTKPCLAVTGGIDTLLIGDSNDFDWTTGVEDADGNPTGYASLARHVGAIGSNQIGNVTVGTPGTGYTTAPTVVFTGGGGSGAAGTAVLSGTTVASVTVTNHGTGYTSAPTISFTGGGGTGAAATTALSTQGANLYEIDSVLETLGVDITQSNGDGSASSYEYVISARLAQMSQALTNFNVKIDGAALCCQLVFIWRMNDGKIFVVGEKYVDDESIPRFRFRQDGSKISTGKKFTEFNGQDLSIKGNYSRLPYEFTGGWAAIESLISS